MCTYIYIYIERERYRYASLSLYIYIYIYVYSYFVDCGRAPTRSRRVSESGIGQKRASGRAAHGAGETGRQRKRGRGGPLDLHLRTGPHQEPSG